jgi:hypothetical protein
MSLQVMPAFLDDLPNRIWLYLPFHDLPKQAGPTLRHQGDEICSRLGVIVPFQANGATVIFTRIKSQGWFWVMGK